MLKFQISVNVLCKGASVLIYYSGNGKCMALWDTLFLVVISGCILHFISYWNKYYAYYMVSSDICVYMDLHCCWCIFCSIFPPDSPQRPTAKQFLGHPRNLQHALVSRLNPEGVYVWQMLPLLLPCLQPQLPHAGGGSISGWRCLHGGPP